MNIDAIDTKLAQAARCLEARDYRGAHALCIDVLKRDPTCGEAFFLLGLLTAAHENHPTACELFDRVGGSAKALAQKARSLLAMNRRDEALAAADAAAALEISDAFTLDTLGVVFSRAGRHEDALPFYTRATAANPNEGDYHYNHGAALQFVGRMNEARAAYQACLDCSPADARALSALVQITPQSEACNYRDTLKDAFAATDEKDDHARLHIGHALAKTHEDLGQPAEAMAWLAKAKAGPRARAAVEEGAFADVFDAAAETLNAPPQDGLVEAQPIFVVGMPRSGTTLVDRILSGHSAVRSAGELSDFALHLKRMTGAPGRHVLDAETLRAAAHVKLDDLAKRYVSGVEQALGLTGRFIDKMPLNFFYVPLILRAMPNARVICLRRHPADTVLSNYRQMFSSQFSYYNYAYDLEAAALYFVRFATLTDRYAEELPPEQFRLIHYEAIVDDIETAARSLTDFCQLSFEPDCLAFHENAAPVATASSAQVRRPLYRSSIGRWRRYRPDIDPALAILVEAGVMEI